MKNHHKQDDTATKFEQQLRDRKAVLLGEIRDTLLRIDAERYANIAAQVSDTKDQAAVELLTGIHHAEVDRDLGEVGDIDAALQRTAAGTYGSCVACGTSIPGERLKAYPTAKRCLRCQQSYERGSTQPKDRQQMLADAAYFRAERRNFCPGYELDDWLAAEREVDAALATAPAP